jgi:predicted RNA binding protein YcfA (HicA-like mRNA interferase family)
MPSPVRFAVVKKLLEQKGYRLDRISGSHHIFKKPGAEPEPEPEPESIPVHHNLVKASYVKRIEKLP